MNAPPPDPLWQTLHAERPLAARLALLACLPVRVTPALLRLARLRLLAEAGTGDEADLWLSDLVETRSSAGLCFRRGVREGLRRQLAADARLLDAVWRQVHLEHARWLTPRGRLEEELAWRLLRDPGDAWIDERWQAVLHELDAGPNAEGLARWVVRAVPDLPPGTLDLESGRRAFYGASLLLGDASVLGHEVQTFLDSDHLAFATRRLPRRRIQVGRVEGGVLISPLRPIDNGHGLDVPATQPLWLQIDSAPGAEGVEARVITLADNEPVTCITGTDTIRLRLIDGSAHVLGPPGSSARSTFIGRHRRPRVQLAYDLEMYGALKQVQLPFVTGVMADLSGHRTRRLHPVAERKFVDIDIDNFEACMQGIGPRLAFQVRDTLAGRGMLPVDLRFDTLEDFEPDKVARKIEPLRRLLDDRQALQARRGAAARIRAIDRRIGEQLRPVLHHPAFQRLEGAWRGLRYLVSHTETNEMLKIRVLNISKQELAEALAAGGNAGLEQSPIYKKVHEEAYGVFGGEPCGCLVGDYEFDHSAPDVALLQGIAQLAAATFAPFIASAAPSLLGMASWQELGTPRDLNKLLQTPGYAAWQALRKTDEARFIGLAMPRFLARLPYGHATNPVQAFDFEEETTAGERAHLVWANAAYAMAANIHRAFSQYGWCAQIRGVESGGLVEDLPVHHAPTDTGGREAACSTETALGDRAEGQLSKLGLLPLMHRLNTDAAVFVSAQSLHESALHDDPEATANAALAARLPYLLTMCRFGQHLKCLVRDKVGSFSGREPMERYLNNWVMNYVDGDPAHSSEETKARHPLAAAEVVLEDAPDHPGFHAATFYLRPHYQLEGLTASLRLVSHLPSGAM